MSYYDDSSLFVAPNGYKTSVLFAQKPMDANGQLAFTRSNDTATRVASNGLIEKVRTNVVTYSQDFSDSSWTKTALTISTSATANPVNGALTAQDAIPTAVSSLHRVFKLAGVVSTANTWSIFAKAKGYNFITIVENGNTSASVSFNLSTGAVSTQISAVGQIQSLGNGWYRCSMIHTTTTTPRFDVYVSPTDSQAAYTGDGTSGVTLFGAQAQASDFGATPYIPTTTAAVSVGPVANLPRIDYTGGGCGKLLLEPQRTNVITFSENFDNAAWIKNAALVTANNTTSPDGYINADKLIESSSTNAHFLIQSPTLTAAAYTFSVFAKAGERNWFLFRQHTLGLNASFNLATGTLGTVQSGLTATIEDYGNDWYRCSVTFTGTAAANTLRLYVTTANNNTSSYAGDNTSGLYLFGAQCELGSYQSSYVPSLGAAVTRGADLAQKTSATALIGQAEGVLFVDLVMEVPEETRRFSLSDGTTSNRILIGQTTSGNILFYTASIGAAQVSFTTSTSYTKGTRLKIAFAYKENDFTGYINGEQIFTDSLGTVPSTTKFSFSDASDSSIFISSVNQALLFKTRLSNSELASLTTL